MDNTSCVKSDPDPLIGQVDFDNWPNYTNDEDVVNKYFYKLYVSQITTDQMIEVMKHLSSSPKGSRNKSVYNTMLKILFNECRFFPKYPLQELSITAELFGKMIKHGLLLSNGPLLLLASRCILEALKRGKTSKMFQFGTIALSQFENSIASYPWFSNSLLSIPDVKETFPQLYKTCEKLQTIMTDTMKNSTYIDQSKGIVIGQNDGQQDLESPLSQNDQTTTNTTQTSYGLDIRSSVGEWELIMGDIDVEVKVPPDTLIDHIYSIFNNMCPDDVEKKAKEISSLLNQEYSSWLLLYIIRTRASKEHNLHDVFANFIENMNYPKLFDQAIQITYLCINSCLKKVEQHKDVLAYRTLLKNLGSWLGRITLYRNMPIIHRNLDMKSVLTKGYENGYLLAVLPFICKTMENIKNSKIFKPPNPWTTAILTFLMEIRDLPNLKTNLVFEVEVLFKHLNLEMSEYSSKTKLLANKKPPKNSPDFELPSASASSANIPSMLQASLQMQQAKAQTLSGSLTSVNNMTVNTQGQQTGDREKLNQLLSKVIREGTVTTTSGTTLINNLHNAAGNLNNMAPTTSVANAMAPNLQSTGPTTLPNNMSVPTAGPGMNVNVNLPNTANFAHNQINMSMSRYIDTMMHNLHNSVVISPSIALFEIQPQFRSLVPIAIERAVRHVLSVVCDHSLSLARMCTKSLISKDFNNEDDENVTRLATRMMFEYFATSLVVVSCNEPLRVAFHESLRSSLQTHRTQDCNDQVLVEQLVQILSQDNFQVCVSMIEKITQEYAVRESDLLFMEILKCIQREPKLPPNFLPTLLTNWNSMNTHQQALATYKSLFSGHPPKTPTSQTKQIPVHSPNSMPQPSLPIQTLAGQSLLGAPTMSSPPNQMTPPSVPPPPTNGLHNVMTLFEECLSELREPLRDISLFPPPFYNLGLEPGKTEQIFSTQSLHVLYSLPHDHEVFSSIIKCLNVVETSGCREIAAVTIAKCLLTILCDGTGSHAGLNAEVLLCILDGLNSINPGVKQVLSNMLYSLPLDQNNNFFNIIVVTGLLRYKLLEWPDLTHYLTLAMERGKNVYAIEMAIVTTAVALIDQKSAPPSVAATLIREIANLSFGSEPCKTYPGIMIKDAWSKLLKDFVDVQNEPKPAVVVLTTILKQNLNTVLRLQHFKLTPNSLAGFQVNVDGIDGKSEEYVEGFGGARRVPLPFMVNDSHRFLFGALFGKWVECSRNVEGDALLFSWRQFFQKFNLQSLFKMEGGTDSFFASCLYSIIHFDKSSKLFNLVSKESNNGNNGNLGSSGNLGNSLNTNNFTNQQNQPNQMTSMSPGNVGNVTDQLNDTVNQASQSNSTVNINTTNTLNPQGQGNPVGQQNQQVSNQQNMGGENNTSSNNNSNVNTNNTSNTSTTMSSTNVGNVTNQGNSTASTNVGNTMNQGNTINASSNDNTNNAVNQGNITIKPLGNESNVCSESPNDGSSTSSSSSSNNGQITLFCCFEGLCKMIDVMLRLVGGVGDIPPCSALQKLLSCLSSIIVHEGHYFSSYNIWLSLMVYFDKLEEPNYVLSKLTFLYALEYVNPTRVPGFSFFYLRLLVHPSLLTGSLKSPKCWGVLSRIFNLLSVYTAEINSHSSSLKEPNNSNVNTNNTSNTNTNLQSLNSNKDSVNKDDKEFEFEFNRDQDYVEYFTSVYFNCVEYVATLCPEFVSANYLNFFGTFAIERLASSVGSTFGSGSKGPSSLKGVVGVKGVDLMPEMKVVPKISNSWTNHISRNRTSLLVLKVLNTIAKFGPPSLSNCQDLDTLCFILTEETNNMPAQSVMTFNSLTLEIISNHQYCSPELVDNNARLLLFLWLMKTLPIKAKYQLVCSITRHLRGPNAHTFFFSCLLITMFEECKNDLDSRHVILRVLLESFIAPGQCPWGVSLVVLELFRNPRFQHTPNYSPQTNALIESILHTINNIAV